MLEVLWRSESYVIYGLTSERSHKLYMTHWTAKLLILLTKTGEVFFLQKNQYGGEIS